MSYTQQTVNYFGAKGDCTIDDYAVLQSIINSQNDIVFGSSVITEKQSGNGTTTITFSNNYPSTIDGSRLTILLDSASTGGDKFLLRIDN